MKATGILSFLAVPAWLLSVGCGSGDSGISWQERCAHIGNLCSTPEQEGNWDNKFYDPAECLIEMQSSKVQDWEYFDDFVNCLMAAITCHIAVCDCRFGDDIADTPTKCENPTWPPSKE